MQGLGEHYMSIIASQNAFKVPGLKPGPLVTLLALADCHNGKTGRCFPSIDHLSEKTNLSTRQVQRHIDSLKASGLISIVRERRDRRWAVNSYTFNWPDHTTPTANFDLGEDDDE